MKEKNILQIGAILFFIGLILIIISWHYSYPISISSIDEVTFSKFLYVLWPGLIFSLIGLFVIGYYSKSKIIIAACSSTIPLLLYITHFFFSFLSSSDCGTVRGMFQVFNKTGINSKIISYFEFPTYFSLNKIVNQVLVIDEKGIAFIFFALYGVLLGLFLFLFFFNLKKISYVYITPFLMIIIYFIGIFSFLNYQWAPQTLALVFFFILLFISTYKLSNLEETKWLILFFLVYVMLVLTHPIISVFFILFFIILTLKKRYLVQILISIISIYIIISIFYTTINFFSYVKAFEIFFQQLGSQYSIILSKSFGEPEGIISQIISLFNRISLPIIWIISIIGSMILFAKRKIDFILIALALSAGIYLVIGLFYNILGLRALQILLIPLTIGFMFFINKWKKPTTLIVIIILILAVFGPMRMAYNNTQFQTDEEANACNFLAINTLDNTTINIGINQVDYGYILCKYKYYGNKYIALYRPGTSKFLSIFNISLNTNDYILYNSNLGKEILNSILKKEQLNNTLEGIILNNKIYNSGKTVIINGIY